MLITVQDKILDPLLSLLYPPKCAICKTLGAELMCERCVASIVPVAEPACPACGQSLGDARKCAHCTFRVPAFDAARAMGAYEGVLQHAIHLLKYRDRPGLAEPLGTALAHYARREAPSLGSLHVDAVAPIPMHPSRRRIRGYNQAERLARTVARELDLPLATDLLIRRSNTRPQVGLSQEARRQNLSNAFAVGNRPPTGMRILLIDDVSTTGSSLHECAKALKAEGASKVYGLTLAAG
jgi:ComF family protein